MIYQTKSKQVKATCWNGDNFDDIRIMLDAKAHCDLYNRCLFVDGSAVNVGEYVLIDDGDRIYKMSAEEFEKQFEHPNKNTASDECFELMFSDLTLGAREALLAFMNVKSEKDLNWDIVPIATIER